jgi:hypothetical protein
MTRKSDIIAISVLMFYFLFTSGFIYEIMGSTITNQMVVPYSIALSGERTGLVGLFTEDDQRCAEWIVYHGDRVIPVVCDGNIGLFLRSYERSNTQQLTDFTGVFDTATHYLFIGSWNTETGKIVVGATSAGLRDMGKLPAVDSALYNEVFRSGDSIVYIKREKQK